MDPIHSKQCTLYHTVRYRYGPSTGCRLIHTSPFPSPPTTPQPPVRADLHLGTSQSRRPDCPLPAWPRPVVEWMWIVGSVIDYIAYGAFPRFLPVLKSLLLMLVVRYTPRVRFCGCLLYLIDARNPERP